MTQAVPARRLGRNGQLRFTFHQLDLNGAAAPKTKYIAPAIQVMLAVSSLDGLDPHNRDRIEDGLGPQGPDVAGGAVRGTAGFALVGTAVGLLAHWRPISAGFAFYGAGWSVYTHIAARARNVVFPKNTPMEIGFGTHESPPPASAGKSSSSRP